MQAPAADWASKIKEERNMLEKLRNELYKLIELYGPLDTRTVDKSRELDAEIVIAMKKTKVQKKSSRSYHK